MRWSLLFMLVAGAAAVGAAREAPHRAGESSEAQPVVARHTPTHTAEGAASVGGVPREAVDEVASVAPEATLAEEDAPGEQMGDDHHVPDAVDRCPDDGEGGDVDDGCPDDVPFDPSSLSSFRDEPPETTFIPEPLEEMRSEF